MAQNTGQVTERNNALYAAKAYSNSGVDVKALNPFKTITLILYGILPLPNCLALSYALLKNHPFTDPYDHDQAPYIIAFHTLKDGSILSFLPALINFSLLSPLSSCLSF